MEIKIGTRASQLAMIQAEMVGKKLQNAGMQTRLVPIETKGDKILDVTISKIGSKGVFTEELETLLRDKEIDIAVHSAKDLQSRLPEEFEIIAYSEREDAHDVLVSLEPKALEQEEKLVIGTASHRREAILKRNFPQHETKTIRGNLNSRLGKLKNGEYDAIILAAAGIKRLKIDDVVIQPLSKRLFIPMVGQGVIAVEAWKGMEDSKRSAIKDAFNDLYAQQVMTCERSFLETLEGGCSIPAFAHAWIEDEIMHVEGGLMSLDGKEYIYEKLEGKRTHSEDMGSGLAKIILINGGRPLLKRIRQELDQL